MTTKKKTKKQLLEESLSEAINPRPKQDRLFTVQSLLENYREQDQPPTALQSLPSTLSEDERPQIKYNAVHTERDLPPTVISFERPQNKFETSTVESVDVSPSTAKNVPSTKSVEPIEFAVTPSTPKKAAVKKDYPMPSTSDRHNDKKIGRFDNRIRKSVIKQIKEFCLKTELSQKEFVEMSAVHFIEMWTANHLKNVDGKTSHDDRLKMMIYKTVPRIINLYRIYNTENKWKYRDDEIASKYNSVDLKLIELGFIQTQFNANFKKINSFEYYKNEIESYLEQKISGELIDFLLNHNRRKWREASGREIDYSFLEEEKNEK